MEIDKNIVENIISYISQYNQFNNLELEGRYTGATTREEFDRCVSYCQSDGDFYENIEDEVLDIFVKEGNFRISITGNEEISNYCKTNVISNDVTVIRKTQEAKPLSFDDINFKINFKKESVEDNVSAIVERLYMLEKSYRYKKRYSYINEKDGVRIDLTVVKAAMGSYTNFVESKIVSKPDQYEIELEVIKKREPKAMANVFLNHLLNLYGAIVDEEHVCSKKEKTDVLKEYLHLCYKDVPLDYDKMPKKYFAGPQPITLERKNIIKPGLGVETIREDYTVTEKADGERYLLYVSSNGNCYFINSRLSVKFTGVNVEKHKNILIDGEYITTDINNDYIKHFAIFDAYYYNGKNIRFLPLVGQKESRLSFVDEFLTNFASKFETEDIKIYKKDFLFGADIFEKASEILKKQKFKGYPYKIDGLIFTPMYLPVGGMFMEDKPEKPVATWKMVYKWKPPEDNTIDFLIKFKKGSSNNPIITFINSNPYRVLDLFVGYNPVQWDKITARAYLENNVARKKSYVAVPFQPSDIVDEGIKSCYIPMKCVCENNDIIEDDSIVEFKYDNTDDLPPFSLKWVPIRVRKDKTELYRKTKALSGAVNDLGSALNIWTSIRKPVDLDMITGKVILNTIPDETNLYYDRKVKRGKFASIAMLKFHTEIKKALITKYKAESIFDLACGKGGLLWTIVDAGFKKIYGIDINRDNIENPIDGIYSRLVDNKNPQLQKLKFAFLTIDGSNKIDIATSITDPDDKHVANVLYGLAKDPKIQKYEKMASDKFDVVSCQFAIHYFFENENKLDNFLYNVDTHLKTGGHFVGTCLNGNAVKSALLNTNTLEGKVNNRVMWSLKKLYTKKTGVDFGEEIEVFMESIGRVIKEYLVNIDILTQKLNKMGYELVENIGFKDVYDESNGLDDTQKMYSFLNMAFVFKKKQAKPSRTFIKKVPMDAV